MVKISLLFLLINAIYCQNIDNIRTVIINGLLATGKDVTEPFLGYILINSEGKIANVVKENYVDEKEIQKEYPKAEIINAENKIVIPGGVDPSVHLEYLEGTYQVESSDDLYSGTIAALCGGTTTVFDYVVPNLEEKGTLTEALEAKIEEAEEKAVIDYSFHIKVNYLSHLLNHTDLSIEEIIKHDGITSFHFDTYSPGPHLNEEQMLEVFQMLRKYGGLAIVNCQDEQEIKSNIKEFISEDRTKPTDYPFAFTVESEKISIEKVIQLAKTVDFPQGIHISHISSEPSVSLIQEARNQGLKITTEVTTHHLLLTDQVYAEKNGIDYMTSPPLRSQADIDALWKGIQDGVIDYVVSDHCPFTYSQRRGKRTKPDYRIKYNEDLTVDKTYGTTFDKWWNTKNPPFNEVPKGLASVESRIILLYSYGVVTNKIDLNTFVAITSTNAAKRFGLYPRKGLIGKGADADIVIIDPNGKTSLSVESLHQNCDVSPFEDLKVKGRIQTVFFNGKKVFDNYALLPRAINLHGTYLKRMRYFLGHISKKEK